MKNYSKLFGFIPVALVTLFLLFTFKDLLLSLNEFVYFNSGDALKNYLHFSLYASYGNGFHINEVNYPFGEHVVFLDNQPLLAFLTKQLNLTQYSVGIINGLPFVALILTSFIVFLIQRFLGLALIVNILSSSIISLMSPQVLRFESHHALAYSFIVPLAILLLLYAHRSRGWFIALSLLTFLVSFIHLYYLLILLFLVAAYALLILIKRQSFSYFTIALMSVVIPFVLVKGMLSFTDKVTDRPETPPGGTTYRSTFEGVFLPQKGAYSIFLKEKLGLKEQNIERIAYVGKLGLPILTFMLFSILLRIVKQQNTVPLFHNLYLFELCWASALVWIFAMYYPLKGIIDFTSHFVPALKQFRSLGRLGWIFFYTFSILMSFQLYNFYTYLKFKTNLKFASIFLFIAFVIWSSDIENNFTNIQKAYSSYKSENIFNVSFNKEKNATLYKHIDFSSFQASVALPLFHVGSEVGYYEGSNLSRQKVFSLSYFHQLPYVSTYSSRVSKNQFTKVEKVIKTGELTGLNRNDKPFLIVADINSLSKTDSIIIQKSKYLHHNEDIYYYEYSRF